MASTLRALLGRPPPPTPGFRAGLAVVSAFFAASALDTPATLPLRQLTVASLVGSSLGWVRPIWFISVGYGLAMVLQAAVIARTSLGLASLTKTSLAALPPPALAALALHAAHGAWLALFLAARDGLLRTYAPKKAAIDARAAKLGPGARAGMWVGVAGLYVCLAVPAWAVATAGRGVLASCPRAATITSAGLSLAAFGLWLEVTADIVKAKDKARNPGGFSHLCVYRICRQPNLLGEALLWWGLGLASAPALWAARAPVPAAAAVVGVVSITAILVGDSKGKAANQARRMRTKAGWSAYAASTPALWPRLPRWGGKGGASGGRVAAVSSGAAAAAATPRRTTPRRAAATPRKRVG